MAKSIPQNIENRLYINGEFVESSDGKKFDIISPYSEEKVASVYEATVEDTNKAVAAAKNAFPSWAELEPHERGVYLSKLGDLCAQYHEELAVLDAISMGRPVSSYFDGFYAAQQLHHYAEAGYYNKGESSLNSKGFVNITFRQPIGVVGAIIPWNVPIILAVHKIGPALAAGCTMVMKTSEKAPLAVIKLAVLAKEAGFPPGVLNIISGFGKPAGSTLAMHTDVRCINFTGSSATGKNHLTNISSRLGGKSPAIVFDDADIEQAAKETANSITFNAGQVCVANSRIYVQESVASRFKSEFAKALRIYTPGNPLDPETTQGPQADVLQFKRVVEYLKIAKEQDGKGVVEMGGGKLDVAGGKGYFIQPTMIIDQSETAQTMKDEIFGPVVGINVFKTEKEAIAKAVDSEFGLYSAVYSKNIDRALRVAKAMEAGTVGVNCTSPTMAPDMPFGGWKHSGQGREGFGYSLDNYLETKAVYIKLSDA
ncbi:aldehyde dehydrogenase [Tothia fuscella]|uniref:aldehyde dehydrogenase (NAD(+)) n=1 Tax=Tothia fuscella TaxID=1048955 RepID=A0A9P4NZA2_9PEZI|nr:aldehyde dehydrogenase [Tothia fuscella]